MPNPLKALLAPGADRAKKFAIQLDTANGDSFKINWDSFKRSAQVKEQLNAAKTIFGGRHA